MSEYVRCVAPLQVLEDAGTCVVLSDATRTELHVFSKDLTEGADPTAVVALGEYQLHDLVQLDGTNVGMIVGVDKNAARVSK